MNTSNKSMNFSWLGISFLTLHTIISDNAIEIFLLVNVAIIFLEIARAMRDAILLFYIHP